MRLGMNADAGLQGKCLSVLRTGKPAGLPSPALANVRGCDLPRQSYCDVCVVRRSFRIAGMFAAVSAAGSAPDPPFVEGELLVQLKQGIKPAAAASLTKLPGLQSLGVVGQFATGATTAAAAAGTLPAAGAVLKLKITDGASVLDKVSELKANPGGWRLQLPVKLCCRF